MNQPGKSFQVNLDAVTHNTDSDSDYQMTVASSIRRQAKTCLARKIGISNHFGLAPHAIGRSKSQTDVLPRFATNHCPSMLFAAQMLCENMAGMPRNVGSRAWIIVVCFLDLTCGNAHLIQQDSGQGLCVVWHSTSNTIL